MQQQQFLNDRSSPSTAPTYLSTQLLHSSITTMMPKPPFFSASSYSLTEPSLKFPDVHLPSPDVNLPFPVSLASLDHPDPLSLTEIQQPRDEHAASILSFETAVASSHSLASSLDRSEPLYTTDMKNHRDEHAASTLAFETGIACSVSWIRCR